MTAISPASQPRGRGSSLLSSLDSWGRLTGIALGIVAAVLLTVVVLDVAVYGPRVDWALRGTTAARQAHEAMLDQQLGVRGFLLSRDERFLEAYERGRDALPKRIAEATEVLAGRGDIGDQLINLRLDQQTWIDRWAAPALERGRTGQDVTEEFLAEDKRLFDLYRARYDEMMVNVLEYRETAVSEQRRAHTVGFGVATAVTIAAGGVAMKRSRSLRRSVREPIDQLLRRMDEIGRGDLDPRPPIEGPTEFAVLGEGLEWCATSLAESRRETKDRVELLAAHSERQDEVLTFAREVAGSLSLRYVLRGVCKHASAVAGGARVVVWLMGPSRRTLDPYADSTGPDMRPLGLEPIAVGDDGIVGLTGQYGRVHDRRGDDDCRSFAVPMVVGAQVVGVLEFTGMDALLLSPDARSVLETMAIHAATAVDAARLHEQTSDMAMTDVLTGLPNRRQLDNDLDVECAASARYGRPLSFLMIDVDHFKSYNDELGHQAGDAALQAVARILRRDLRPTDRSYRFGGEEFSLLLRETGRDEAVVLAERLRAAVEHHFTSPHEPRAITISIGIVALPGAEPTPDALVRAADDALYEAKRDGRNQVKLAQARPN